MLQDWIALGPLGFAIVVVALSIVLAGPFGRFKGLPKELGPASAVGPVNFDFSKSFASTITALGALLTTVLAAKGTVTVAKPHLTASTYAALSIFFGILVVVGPFAYRALSKTSDVTNHNGDEDIQYQGYAWGFLLSVTLTVWAVYGQLVTVFFFLMDIQSSALFQAAVFFCSSPRRLSSPTTFAQRSRPC